VTLAAADALARSPDDPAQLLDVDVNQLAGPVALVAQGGLQAEPAELAHPDAEERSNSPNSPSAR
jgi:hypothetical protein